MFNKSKFKECIDNDITYTKIDNETNISNNILSFELNKFPFKKLNIIRNSILNNRKIEVFSNKNNQINFNHKIKNSDKKIKDKKVLNLTKNKISVISKSVFKKHSYTPKDKY